MMTQKRQTALKYTLLTAAAGLIIACWLALAGACGPAAPAEQTATSTDETLNTPTPTPGSSHADDGLPAVPPPLPTLTRLEREYPHLDGNLHSKIEQYEAAQAASGATGASGQTTPPVELVLLAVYTDTADRVDGIKRLLQHNGAEQILCEKGSDKDFIKGVCSAYTPVSLLLRLAEQPGVLRVDDVSEEFILLSDPHLPSSQQTPANRHGVTSWRLAGATGINVQVSIIDGAQH